MAPGPGDAWGRLLAALGAGPAALGARVRAEALGAQVLSELRSERRGEAAKGSLLAVISEFPTLLWPDPAAAEAAAAGLLDALALLPPRPSALRRLLLLATTSVLAACGALGPASAATARLLAVLLALAAERAPGPERRVLRAVACECLRELESCLPGLLAGQLGLLRGLQDTSGTQAHRLLFVLALRNALWALARAGPGAPARLPGLLASRPPPGGNGTPEARGAPWPGPWDWSLVGEDDGAPAAPPVPLDLGPAEARELRAVVSQLLDASYLLTPPAQARLLRRLSQVLRAVRGQPPALLKPQLVRLLGTAQVSLLHTALALKDAFGEALFTAQDEALLLRRLVAAAQHPALPPPARLFYLHCLLHFPENWPLGPAGEEGAPVLLTPGLATGLLPALLQDPQDLLARLHLLCLLLREELSGDGPEDQALAYLQGLLAGLRRGAAQPGAPPAAAALCFRASFLATRCLAGHPGALARLTKGLAELYRDRPDLAPRFVDLLERAGPVLGEPLGRALQRVAVAGAGGVQALRWHLRILAKVAGAQPSGPTLGFLRAALRRPGDWAGEQALLGACRALLQGTLGPGGAVPGALADLLQELARCLDDPDGRDRARLYYSLFTHLARPKLRSALGPARAVPSLSSSLVEENEGFALALTVRETRAPLRLRRAPRQAKEPPVILGLAVEASETLYSLELRFHVLGSPYEPLEAVRVPCLRPGGPPKLLLLRLEPRRPFPALLDVNVLYTDPSGLTCHSQLPSLPIAFADLFLPLLPPSEERLPGAFEDLWAACLPGGAESRMWGPWRGPALPALVTRHWEPFVVAAAPPSRYQVAIRLPPSSQLLLQLEASGEDGARVALRTDDWALLPLAGDYLRGLGAAA